jgi:rRNA maturation endonuclease Nob1
MGKSLDMNGIEQNLKRQVTSSLNQRKYEVTCPHCKNKVSVAPGKSPCPMCGAIIDVNLNISF